VLLNCSRRVPGISGEVELSRWISRQHAKIHVKNGSCFLEDTSSTGSYIDNVRVEKGKLIELKNGSEIFFGTDAFKYRLPPKVGEKHPDKSDFLYRVVIEGEEKDSLSGNVSTTHNLKRLRSPDSNKESARKKAKISSKSCSTPTRTPIRRKKPNTPNSELRRTKAELESVRKERDEIEKQKEKILKEKKRDKKRFEKLVKEKCDLEKELKKSLKDYEHIESNLKTKLAMVDASRKKSLKERDETERRLRELEKCTIDAKKEANKMEVRLKEMKHKQTEEAKKLLGELALVRTREQEYAKSVRTHKEDIIKAQKKMRLLEKEKSQIRGNLVGELEILKRDRDRKGFQLKSLSGQIEKLKHDKQQLVQEGEIRKQQSLSPADLAKMNKLQREIVILKNHVAKQNKDKQKLKESLLKKEAAVEKMAEELECGICCEFYTDSRRIVTCGHAFCSKCLEDWMKESGKNRTCPTCRKKFKKEAVTKAFDLDNQVAHVKAAEAQKAEESDLKTQHSGSPDHSLGTPSKAQQNNSPMVATSSKNSNSNRTHSIQILRKNIVQSKLLGRSPCSANANSPYPSSNEEKSSPRVSNSSVIHLRRSPASNPRTENAHSDSRRTSPTNPRARAQTHSQVQRLRNGSVPVNRRNRSQPAFLRSPTDIQLIFKMAQSRATGSRQKAIETAKNLGSLTDEQSLHLAMLLGRSSSKQAWEWVLASLTAQRVADSTYMEYVISKWFPKSETGILNLGYRLKEGFLPVSRLWPLFKLIPSGSAVVTLGVELLKAFLSKVIESQPVSPKEAHEDANLKGWFNVLDRTVKELEKGKMYAKAAHLSKSFKPVLLKSPVVAFSIAVWFRSSKFYQCALRLVDQILRGIIPAPLKEKMYCVHTLKFKLLNDIRAKGIYFDRAYEECKRSNPAAAKRIKKLRKSFANKIKNRQRLVLG